MKFKRIELGTYSDSKPRIAAKPTAPMTAASVRAEERQRVADVFASDASKGKERTAARLLAKSSLPAGGIIELLADVGPDPAMMPTGAGATVPIKGSSPAAKASWGRTFARLGWN